MPCFHRPSHKWCKTITADDMIIPGLRQLQAFIQRIREEESKAQISQSNGQQLMYAYFYVCGSCFVFYTFNMRYCCILRYSVPCECEIQFQKLLHFIRSQIISDTISISSNSECDILLQKFLDLYISQRLYEAWHFNLVINNFISKGST